MVSSLPKGSPAVQWLGVQSRRWKKDGSRMALTSHHTGRTLGTQKLPAQHVFLHCTECPLVEYLGNKLLENICDNL